MTAGAAAATRADPPLELVADEPAPDGARAVLGGVLDDLDAAHHRPFSRA